MRLQKNLSFSIVVAILTSVLLGGCAPQKTTVKSNLSANYNVNVERIFVVIDTRGLDSETQKVRFKQAEFGLGVPDTLYFSTEFEKDLISEFDDLAIACEVYRNTSDVLDEDKCTLLAEQFEADEVVWVREDFIGMYRNNGTWALVPYEEVAELTLDASIRSKTDSNTLDWRASIKVIKGTQDWTHMAQASASALVELLMTEVMIDRESSQ